MRTLTLHANAKGCDVIIEPFLVIALLSMLLQNNNEFLSKCLGYYHYDRT